MSKRHTYTLAEMRDYDPRTQHERDINWNKELKLYAIFTFLISGEAAVVGFGSGGSLIICAIGAAMLWNLAGRQEGILSALFRYLSVLAVFSLFGMARTVCALYILFCVGWGAVALYKAGDERTKRRA
jgi:hypothetical protein